MQKGKIGVLQSAAPLGVSTQTGFVFTKGVWANWNYYGRCHIWLQL